jgi:hypothetical protein
MHEEPPRRTDGRMAAGAGKPRPALMPCPDGLLPSGPAGRWLSGARRADAQDARVGRT